MINLNGKEFEGTTIFNGGNAGLVHDVTIAVTKRQVDEPENYPDYKLTVKDATGAEVTQGFYYFTPNPEKPDEYNEKRATQEVSRILHVARAVMGKDYSFPEVNSIKEAYDTLFTLVKDNAGSKKFNVFVTYGTTMRPSKYLGLRYFDFIEPAGETSTMRTKRADNMERVEADAPMTQDNSTGTEVKTSSTPADEPWA